MGLIDNLISEISSSSGVDHEIARDNLHTVRNNTGSAIAKGKWVYINGSTGAVPTVALAKADSSSTLPAFGVAIADIADNSFGQIVTMGDAQDINTSAFNDGDVLYISASTAGDATATRATGTNQDQRVGVVVKSSVGAGIIAVLIGGAFDPTTTTTFTNKTLSSPTLTGTPLAPTATIGVNTTQIATTAFVQSQKISPVFTGTPTAPTAAIGTNNTQLATTAFVNQGYRYIGTRILTSGTGATFTPTAGTRAVYIELTGAGGGGGGCSHNGTAGNLAIGGCGGTANTVGYWLTDLNQTFTYTIGSGGVGGVGGNNGTVGGNTTFIGSVLGTLTAHGGGNGQGTAQAVTGNVFTLSLPPEPTDGNILNYRGGRGHPVRWVSGSLNTFPVAIAGFFGGGLLTEATGNGENNTAKGGGGAGAAQFTAAVATRTGGNGGGGLFRIFEYA